jgi:hypothetical protein
VANRERECDKESFVEFLKSFCSLLKHEIKNKVCNGGQNFFFHLGFQKIDKERRKKNGSPTWT